MAYEIDRNNERERLEKREDSVNKRGSMLMKLQAKTKFLGRNYHLKCLSQLVEIVLNLANLHADKLDVLTPLKIRIPCRVAHSAVAY